MPTDSDTLTFDPDELRRRYREERDKRIREDGNEQYLEVTGIFDLDLGQREFRAQAKSLHYFAT